MNGLGFGVDLHENGYVVTYQTYESWVSLSADYLAMCCNKWSVIAENETLKHMKPVDLTKHDNGAGLVLNISTNNFSSAAKLRPVFDIFCDRSQRLDVLFSQL